MIILQGAIHIFTEQPNSVAKSIYNGLRRQMTHLLEYETIKTSTIIQYPHAVSYFCELNLSYDYIAMTYSKKKGVPVLVSIVGKKVNQGLEVEEALRLYWGNRGKCISKIEAFSTGNAISAHTEGIETLRNEFKEIFPNCGGLVATLGNELPLCFAEKLSNELGVFLGGDTFEEYVVFHHKFLTWMEVNGYDPNKHYTQEEIDDLVAKSPYYKATSNDVDWLMKVKMQGRIQKWVDHSISVTINLPNSVDEELVNRLYVEAWRSGCKGCTVYRDGSRAGVLISTKKDKKKEEEECHCKPPQVVEVRPKVLEADVVRFQNNKEKWVAFVGLLDGRPYEIFTGLADDDEGIMLPKNVSKGTIIKSYDEDGKKHYDFQFKKKRGYKMTIEGLDGKFDPEFWNYAKLISGVLRNGMPILDVVTLIESLHLNTASINTWKNGVARALKQYIPDGTKSKEKCPNCGQETLVYQNNCPVCMSCGHSKWG